MNRHWKLTSAAAVAATLGASSPAWALLSFNVDAGTFGGDTNRYNAAVNSLTAVVGRYNVYGDFGNYNIYAYYNSGIPTAQSDYLGSIGYGGTYPNERVTQHESNHYLGSGTFGNWYNLFNNAVWTGPRVNQLIQQFDGEGSVLRQSGVHFYNYGLNYDSEVTDDSILMRNIAIMYAMRADMGNGNTANPWSATNVTLTASDPAGRSAFNWFGGGYSGGYAGWSDKYFAHSGAAYATGGFDMRTPTGFPSWKFYGDSLTVNAGGRLLFNGYGNTGVVTINNLTLAGGTVRHDQFPQDVFQLAGNAITVTANSTFEAGQGNIVVNPAIGGTGGLTFQGAYTTTLKSINTYTGGTIVAAGTLALNAGGAAGAIRGALTINNGATVRLNAADALGTGAGTSVTLVNVNGGTVDNAASGANGYNANFTLAGGTLSASGGGAYQINAGGGRAINALASANSSTISGNVVIRGATAVLPIGVADGAAANDLVISGAIRNSPVEAGANGINKTGAGTLLLSGPNTYTGATTVGAGTLAFSTSQSNIGPVTIADSAALRVSAAGPNTTTLTAAALTLGSASGANLVFDLAATDTVAPLISTGTLTANGTVNVAVQNGGTLSSGSHTLVGYTAFAGSGTFSPTTLTLGPRSTGTLVNDGTSGLVLNVLADRPIWTGGDNGAWAAGLAGVNKNWKLQTALATTDYLDGDNVLFDDTAAGSTSVIINGGNVAPAAVTVNNTAKTYSINSTGGFGIVGSGALIKSGTSALTISSPNTYSGGTTVNAGTLIAGNATALGTGGLKMNGGVFANTVATTVNGPLTATGSNVIGYAAQNGNLTINGGLGGNGVVRNFVGSTSSYNVFFNGDFSNFTGALNYTCDSGAATGWWRFGSNNATVNLSNASVVINKGNLTNLATAFSKNFGFVDGVTNATIKIGALYGDGVFQAAYNAGPNTLEVGALGVNTVFNGVIAGGNAGTNLNVTKVGTGTLTLNGTNLYTGTTTISGGTLIATANASIGADSAPVVIDGGTLRTTAGITTARSVTVGPAGGTINIAAVGTAGSGQLFLSSGNALLGSGPLLLTGNGTLNATGAGNLRLGSANPYSGVATIRNGGILEYGTAGAVDGAASIVLGNEGELAVQGGGATVMPNAVTVTGGTNSVLSFENGAAGVASGPIALNANLTVALRNWYNYAAVQSGTISGVISGAGNVAVNSGLGTGGTLSLGGNNTLTGNLAVGNATVAATLGINDFTAGGRASGAFGNEKTAGRTVTVNTGGTVSLATGNVLGSGGSTLAQAPALTFVVNAGGTLNTAASTTGSGGGDANILGPLTLNGGKLTTGNGFDPNYQAVILLKNVTVGGTTASVINTTASNVTANGVMLGDVVSGTDTITFTVADATGTPDADLVVSARLTNSANSVANPAALGALAKAGPGTMSLIAPNTYSGGTVVQAGTLAVRYVATSASAATPLLSGAGTDVQNGRVVFDYSTSTTPVAVVRSLLTASYQATTTPGVMDTGTLRSTTSTAARGLGYKDDGAGNVIVMATLYGDADLDGGVSINDFNALAGNFGQSTGKVWTDGDFDYDGGVSINDFNLLAASFGQTLPASGDAWTGLLAFAAAHNDLAAFEAVTGVPEPTAMALLAAGAVVGLRRRRAVA